MSLIPTRYDDGWKPSLLCGLIWVAMRWRTTAVVMIVWSAVAALATTFIFSCCVLPFHKQIHAALPLCHLAKAIAVDESSEKDAARTERSAAQVGQSVPPSKFVVAISQGDEARFEEGSAIARAIITHGALRCDQDVGLLTLLAVFRI